MMNGIVEWGAEIRILCSLCAGEEIIILQGHYAIRGKSFI